MFLSLTNVKISNTDFNWKKQIKNKNKNKTKQAKKKTTSKQKKPNQLITIMSEFLKYNRKIIEIAAKSIRWWCESLHLTHERTLCWLGTAVEITHVLWVQASPLKIIY